MIQMGRKLEKRKLTEDENEVKVKKAKTSVADLDCSKDEHSIKKKKSKKTFEDVVVNKCKNDSEKKTSVEPKNKKRKNTKEKLVINNDNTLNDAKGDDLNTEAVAAKKEPKTKDEKNRNVEKDLNDNTLNNDLEMESVNKKKKKKEKNKKKKELSVTDCEKTETEENKRSPKELAIAYLKLWKKHRDEWKFQKVRQVWLLSNMLDSEMVKDKHFKTLLLYLDGLKGKAREKTSTTAQNIIESESDNGVKVDRARQILQQLSTE